MGNLTDPPATELNPKDDVSFHYWRRVFALVVAAGIVIVVIATSRHTFSRVTDDENHGVWISVLAVAAVLVAITAALTALARDPDRRNTLATPVLGLRWVSLVLAALATSHFGSAARFAEPGTTIIQIELAGSNDVIEHCTCTGLVDAIDRDFWFIGAYVLLLGLLAFWAGAYFRLQVLRRARTTMVAAIIVAGALDVVEDVCMRYAFTHGLKSDVLWKIAAICAWGKFTLFVVVLVYLCAGAFAWWATPRWVRLASWVLPHDAQTTAEPDATDAPEETKETAHSVQSLERAAADNVPPTRSSGGALRMTRGKQPEQPALGIALSGGGIRASSISLGALQALENESALGWGTALTVTAVSGGSNMAAGWSIARSTYAAGDGLPGNPDRLAPGDLAPQPWAYSADGGLSPEERHLVDNLGYLAATQPRGSSTDPAAPDNARSPSVDAAQTGSASYRPTAYATIVSGLAVNTIVLLSVLWVVTRPAGWVIRGLADKGQIDEHGTLDPDAVHDLVISHSFYLPGVAFLLIGFVFLMLWVLTGQMAVRGAESSWPKRAVLQGLRFAAYGPLALGSVLILTLWGFVELVGLVGHASLAATLSAVGGSFGVIGSVMRILRRPAARFAPVLGGIVFIVVALALAALAVWQAAHHGVTWAAADWKKGSSGWNWLAAVVFLIAVQLCISPERWSLGPFYRGKLRLAYATFRTVNDAGRQVLGTYKNDNVATTNSEREPGLSSFTKKSSTIPTAATIVPTPLVVCATSTVSSRAVRAHYGTPALSFTFDPDNVTLHLPQDKRGVWLDYSARTRTVDLLGRGLRKRMTTMMAVAIASAAVSPAMGRLRIGPTSMLLTFFNIRLGVWVANPRYVAQLEQAGHPTCCEEPGYPRTGLGYLFKEFFGIHDLDDPYLYLTDGGHWENTGIVELLRRSDITEFVCVDADSGPGDATSSLGKAIDIAPLECGVRIDISLDPLRARPSCSRAPAYAQRTVNLGFVMKSTGDYQATDQVGVLWYSKPGLTRTMPAELLAFHESHQTFPRISTMDQFFDTSTFVAYRDLGRYNARAILAAREELQGVLAGVFESDEPRETLQELALGSWVAYELNRVTRGFDDALLVAFCTAVQDALTMTPIEPGP
jgi:hypothetical protein